MRVDLEALAAGIDDAFPPLDDEARALALAVHRLLARGRPVDPEAVGRAVGRSRERVEAALERWPGVFRAGDGRVVGFWGLGLEPTAHRFEVEGRVLYTWCAWDALFLPEILGVRAAVVSRCPATGADVRMRVDAAGTTGLRPPRAVVTLLDVGAWQCVEGNNVVATCCRHINVFASRDAARRWRSGQPRDDILILDVEEAHALGRLANRLRYGAMLDAGLGTDPPAEPAKLGHLRNREVPA